MISGLRELTIREKRKWMNDRVEATQTLNPLTGQPYAPYLESQYYSTRGIFEDSLQAHLRAMEEKNPCQNRHERGFLGGLVDRLLFIKRASQERKGKLELYRITPKLYFEIGITISGGGNQPLAELSYLDAVETKFF